MNLIQVQERLKDLPLQAVMAYANGMNPDVPPYLALGEMERRKRVSQQSAPQQTPSGTVKEQLEQQAGLAGLQQLRMQQAQQQMAQNAMGQPTVPEGTPQPAMPAEPEPEVTGIANAAAQPGALQPGVLGLAGGGVVAFARAGDVDEDEDDDEDDDDVEPTVRPEVPAVARPVAEQPQIASRDLISGPGLRVPQGILAAQAPQMPQQAGPQGSLTAQQLANLQAVLKSRIDSPPTISPEVTRESMASANPALYGVLTKPVGQDYLAGLQSLMAKQGEQDTAAKKQIQAQRRLDFYKSLIASGEASRGQKGLGALLGGFGRTMIPALQARAQEEADIQGQGLKREGLLNEARYKIENLQRAEATTDLKAQQKARTDLFSTAVKAYVSGNTALAREIGAIAGIREREIAAAAQIEAAKIRAAAKGQGAEKITDQERGVQRYYNAMVAEGKPPNAITWRDAQEAYLRGKGVASLTSTAARQGPLIDAELRKREMLNTELWGKSEAEKQAWRTAERDKIVADVEAGRLRLMGPPGGAPTTPAPAPLGTRENPIKLPSN